jgi:Flp pilus assembly pilin Flp
MRTGAPQEGSNMKHVVKKFLADEAGVTAIEYGLGTNLRTKFTSINSSLH